MIDLLLFLFALFILLLIFGAAAFTYIGEALGLYRMMRTTGLSHAWTAWVPLCNLYALGALADHQASRNEGKTTNYRKKLLIWTLILFVLCMLFLVAFFATAVAGILEGFFNVLLADDPTQVAPGDNLQYALVLCAVMIPLYVVDIITIVYYCIALHRVHKLFAPDNAVVLTVLAIFVSIALPIILFVLSRRQPVYTDDGTGPSDYDLTPPPAEKTQSAEPGWNIYSR